MEPKKKKYLIFENGFRIKCNMLFLQHALYLMLPRITVRYCAVTPKASILLAFERKGIAEGVKV